MNKHEVAGVLAYFTAAFPSMEITHDTADVWANELADIDPDLAPEAMHNVVKDSEFVPTIARFREACRVVAYHQRVAHPMPALEPVAAEDIEEPDYDFHAAMNDLRDKLANWSKTPHNHKGPSPCPVCGSRAKEPA